MCSSSCLLLILTKLVLLVNLIDDEIDCFNIHYNFTTALAYLLCSHSVCKCFYNVRSPKGLLPPPSGL